ncbi:carbohydrate-binding module family 20 domain-containing protein [Terrabacter sp. NPDC000476]|uniref:carbohydrate-binding module family 20 domain-containing protein n=1 Tax=Terrabacter sp. NPDC000476 TaxID=3154258 RepID=UPI00331D44B8
MRLPRPSTPPQPRSRGPERTRPRTPGLARHAGRGRLVAGALAAVAALGWSVAGPSSGPVAVVAQASATPPGGKDVTATLFEWRYDAVARECTNVLGPKGYGFVEVSPAAEHIQGSQWWTSYQPVSYRIGGRLGDQTAFRTMVSTCHAAGVKVVADVVVNHMSAGSGTGTAGSSYTKYGYPSVYSDRDFHTCRQNISNYADRTNVQTCELVGLADLDTGSDYVRGAIAGYLNTLLGLGVDGFRVDGAKHVPATDLAAIKAKLTNPGVFWVHEVIYGAGEAVQPTEYTGSGDVDEFRAAYDLKRVFTSEKLSYLGNWGASWDYLPSGNARTFVDNWDTERNGSTLSYKAGATYTLANVFMLAWPYGSPNVFSGYEWSDPDAGPPLGGAVNSCYADGWKCQHAWSQIAGMVGFRNAVAGTAVTNWWSNGNNAIAFGRGAKGYVVVNHETGPVTSTFQTSLPAGAYCDVTHGTVSGGACSGATYTVGASGTFTATVGANETIALHVAATTGAVTATASVGFGVNATTSVGQDVYVAGDNAALGAWAPASALKLDPATYPVWRRTVALTPGTVVQYKYLRKDAAGAVTWESGANRSVTVPASGTLTLNDTWRP